MLIINVYLINTNYLSLLPKQTRKTEGKVHLVEPLPPSQKSCKLPHESFKQNTRHHVKVSLRQWDNWKHLHREISNYRWLLMQPLWWHFWQTFWESPFSKFPDCYCFDSCKLWAIFSFVVNLKRNLRYLKYDCKKMLILWTIAIYQLFSFTNRENGHHFSSVI